MTIQQYKQQLYDACKEHSFFAQQALDRYDAATTDKEREQARIDNVQHLAACHALRWALDKAIDFEQQLKQAKIGVLNELKEKCKFDGHTVAVYKNDIEEMIKELKK